MLPIDVDLTFCQFVFNLFVSDRERLADLSVSSTFLISPTVALCLLPAPCASSPVRHVIQ